jgi:hypothetical protein
MTPTIVLLICGLVPHSLVAVDRCDVIHTSHFYDEKGSLVFDQLIFWVWRDGDICDYRVLGWRLLKTKTQIPISWHGKPACLWFDGETLRLIIGSRIRETWDQSDPEVVDRDLQPVHQRRGLTGEFKYKINMAAPLPSR